MDIRMLLLYRFLPGGGWIQIFIVALYGGLIAYKMQDPGKVPFWRILTWTVFSVVFFTQLLLGILVSETFLLTGKLHLPIPMMIIGGPVYRSQLSIMTLLFLSTLVLTGPAWCSHLCYFGAIDGLVSRGKGKITPLKRVLHFKGAILFLVILIALIFRFANVPVLITTISAAGFGIGGVAVIVLLSVRKKQMMHCIYYCPVGTLVNYFRFVNPFRMYIDTNCTSCMKCTAACRYNALNAVDIKQGKPGLTCTLCGDCIHSCPEQSIKYRFFKLSPESSRRLYLFLTISLHAVFLALGRI